MFDPFNMFSGFLEFIDTCPLVMLFECKARMLGY